MIGSLKDACYCHVWTGPKPNKVFIQTYTKQLSGFPKDWHHSLRTLAHLQFHLEMFEMKKDKHCCMEHNTLPFLFTLLNMGKCVVFSHRGNILLFHPACTEISNFTAHKIRTVIKTAKKQTKHPHHVNHALCVKNHALCVKTVQSSMMPSHNR